MEKHYQIIVTHFGATYFATKDGLTKQQARTLVADFVKKFTPEDDFKVTAIEWKMPEGQEVFGNGLFPLDELQAIEQINDGHYNSFVSIFKLTYGTYTNCDLSRRTINKFCLQKHIVDCPIDKQVELYYVYVVSQRLAEVRP